MTHTRDEPSAAANPSARPGVIETILGPIEPVALGRTYMHEHVFTRTVDVQNNWPGEWGCEERRIADAAAKLAALAAQGVKTLVDLTVIGLGRDIQRLQRVATQVPDLNLVVATGIYTYDSVPFYFRHREPRHGREDPMTSMFLADINDGIAGTSVKAGMLKCAIDEPGLTSGVERVMRAVARAHHASGVPITVHTHPGTRTGLDVHRILCIEERVAPQNVVLGHAGDTTDCDHLCELADLGFVLGMDRFGLNLSPTFEQRAGTVIEMCRRGYARQMVLSQDAACYIDWLDPERAAKLFPDWNYLHLANHVLPYLREHGVDSRDIDAMLVTTPERVLTPGCRIDR